MSDKGEMPPLPEVLQNALKREKTVDPRDQWPSAAQAGMTTNSPGLNIHESEKHDKVEMAATRKLISRFPQYVSTINALKEARQEDDFEKIDQLENQLSEMAPQIEKFRVELEILNSLKKAKDSERKKRSVVPGLFRQPANANQGPH